MIERLMKGLINFIRIIAILVFITVTCVIGLIIFSSSPDDLAVGPYQNFVVDDVSKPQQFIIPARFIPPVVIRYRIEGVVDDSASVSFQTSTYPYGHVKFKGVVADSAVSDFYETKDMQINYEPKGAKNGHIVIKAALNW